MNSSIIVKLTSLILDANPMVLVAVVCIVALLVILECVRQFCKVLRYKKETD